MIDAQCVHRHAIRAEVEPAQTPRIKRCNIKLAPLPLLLLLPRLPLFVVCWLMHADFDAYHPETREIDYLVTFLWERIAMYTG